ncbi:TOP2, partial [Symbiodinium microadriaticum]
MNKIEVTIDPDENFIRVLNNGNGIPIVMHQEHNIYVPELIFGHLLTGSNFDDDEQKTTGGRNGYGAKLANIFSSEFIIETADSGTGLKFRQVYSSNMSTRSTPEIKKYSGSDYTCITFKPDLQRFKMDFMDDDIVSLLSKRVYDIAGTNTAAGAKLNVFLNGEKINIHSFQQYITLFRGLAAPCAFERINDRWEVGVAVSDGSFQQVSFVNSICTIKGGQHVNYIVDQLTNKLIGTVKKKNKGTEVKATHVKNHLAVFVNALVVNPAFDSQTKENLTTKPSSFGSTCPLPDKFLKKVETSGVVDNILSWAKFKQSAELKKKGGSKKSKLLGITKLDDANFAGTAKSRDCTLILTEGDSAKALAISGLGVVGRDYYGVFPLKGKLLNVREAPHQQILKNEEIQNIAKILGLSFGKTYEDVSSLRYGHLMIMTDQVTFFTIPEYHTWKEEHNDARGWRVKYYKGLGTSTSAEAKEYFSHLNTHEINFSWNDRAGNAIELAFAKKRVDDRKQWLLAMEPGLHIDYAVESVTYNDFVNQELILFSHADNQRSIPHFLDGFKPSQRKVLFSCFKRNLKHEIKVAQLAGYVSEHSAYHHGEASLTQTIIGMAQKFVGASNINLLTPCGQFGTRLMMGKDAASPRYVFTKLENITRCIFHPDDDPLLTYLDEDGQSIEPVSYVPVIPMVLVNGCEGIGTGWSTSVPSYDPRQIIANIRSMIAGEDVENTMQPWYRGFSGEIRAKTGKDSNNYTVSGIIEQTDDCTIVISELPVGKSTTDYKQFLETMIIGGPMDSNGSGFIKDIRENHTDTKVFFTLNIAPEKIDEINHEPGGLQKKFKLDGSCATSNMHMFDMEGHIQKFDRVEEVMEAFFDVRLEYYEKRKTHLASKLSEEWEKLDNKVRFILAVIHGELVVSNRKKADILAELFEEGYKTFLPVKKIGQAAASPSEEESEDSPEDTEPNNLDRGYDYLLSMKLWSLTLEKVQELCKERDNKRELLDTLLAKAAHHLWLEDLDALEDALDVFEGNIVQEEEEEQKAVRKATKAGNKTNAPVAMAKSAAAKLAVKVPLKGTPVEEEDLSKLPLLERMKRRIDQQKKEAKKTVVDLRDEDNCDDSESEESGDDAYEDKEPAPRVRKTAAASRPARAAVLKPKVYSLVDSESEDEEDSASVSEPDDNDEEESDFASDEEVKPKAKAKKAAAVQKS